MAPGKYILVISEKSRKFLADRKASKGTNLYCLVRLRVVKNYLFKPFNGLYHRLVFFYVHGLEVVIHLHHSYVAFMCSHLISASFLTP